MASRTTLNEKNLEALGAERLAALLMEISTGNANAKRRLRMELAGVESPSKLVNEIRKRLASIGNATTNIGWRSLKAFKADLDSQRRLISDQVARAAPVEALDLMWTFLLLSDTVLERTTDTSGEVIAIFRQASADLPAIATAASPAPSDLLDRTAQTILCNGYGQSDGLIPALAGLLGDEALAQLRERLMAAGKAPESRPALRTRKTSRWRRGRRLERATVSRRSRPQIVHHALLEIADALNDVDAYIALQPDIRLPVSAARVAERLTAAGRSADALTVLDQAKHSPRDPAPAEWQTARIAALEALGRGDEAQSFRLASFHRTLNPDLLRAYLKRLPDFDDIEAEDEALDFVAGLSDARPALDFLTSWPSFDRAARLVIARSGELDGNDDDLLPFAAEKLTARYPLAAVLLLRRMIEATLNNSRTLDYERAADQLADCRRLDALIDDYGGFPDHETFVKHLRASHGRKTEFWAA